MTYGRDLMTPAEAEIGLDSARVLYPVDRVIAVVRILHLPLLWRGSLPEPPMAVVLTSRTSNFRQGGIQRVIGAAGAPEAHQRSKSHLSSTL